MSTNNNEMFGNIPKIEKILENHAPIYKVMMEGYDTPQFFTDTEGMTKEVASRTNIPEAFVELVLTMEDDVLHDMNFIMSPEEIKALGVEGVWTEHDDVPWRTLNDDKARDGISKCTGLSLALVNIILDAEFDVMRDAGMVSDSPPDFPCGSV